MKNFLCHQKVNNGSSKMKSAQWGDSFKKILNMFLKPAMSMF